MDFQDYQHPEYPQLFGEFIPRLSALDLLMNCGGERGFAILSSGQPDYFSASQEMPA